MRTFRLQLRFLVPLVIILVGTAYLAVPLMDRLTLRWFARDLDMRGTFVANALAESLVDRGIRVNAVAPGPIWTPLIPASFALEKVEQFGTDVPMGRAGGHSFQISSRPAARGWDPAKWPSDHPNRQCRRRFCRSGGHNTSARTNPLDGGSGGILEKAANCLCR